MIDLGQERILITGGAGFLGTHVQKAFLDSGARTLLIPRSKDYDLTTEEAAVRMYSDLDPTVVVHLAAEVGGIGANEAHPGRFFYANMAMGLHVIEQARRYGVKKLVVVGTVCGYPKHCEVPFVESDLFAGYPEETNAPYGVAKRALSVMLQAYRAEYGLCGVYLLPANLYGPGDNFDPLSSHVIPALIRKFGEAVSESASEVELWGTGQASREFLFAEDAARGIVLATERYDSPEPVNLGTGQEILIRELAERIAGLMNYKGHIRWNTTRPDGQPRRCLDTTRARAFGFEASASLNAGLSRTVNWWRAA